MLTKINVFAPPPQKQLNLHAPMVVKTLLLVGKLDESSICKHVLKSHMVVRTTLNLLLEYNYVDMIVLPKRGDYNANTCVYVWSCVRSTHFIRFIIYKHCYVFCFISYV